MVSESIALKGKSSMWIWKHTQWPQFTWDNETLAPRLRQIYLKQGQLLGRASVAVDAQFSLDTLLANILYSSAIEGEQLNAFSLRSSLANRLGISEERPYPTSIQTDGLAEIMLDAVKNWQQPLSMERLLGWHALLFPVGYTWLNPIQGGVLRGNTPMQVVSGRLDKPRVHFEAPPRENLQAELTQFITWFNQTADGKTLDPVLRAGIAHLWFVTLHPFDDGNGRLTRLLTDLALAQTEHQSIRLYAISVSILERRKQYYEILEQTQKGELNITAWLDWFLQTLDATLQHALDNIAGTLAKKHYWQSIDQSQLNSEQVKVLNRLLDGDFPSGINSSQYQKLAKVSRATATRHLAYLVEMGCLVKSDSGGRSTRYVLRF